MGAEASLIGSTLAGRFRITEFLSEGGMGAIYRGVDETEPGPVAIKVMNVDLARDATFVKRFHREARTAASLRHRSSVRVVAHGLEAGKPYIVMELIEGAELHAILAHGEGRMPEARAARLMAQVCSALAAAHDLGIVHRDLKPENIMVLRDPEDPAVERAKVLDFGIAKIMAPELCTSDALPVSSMPDAPSSNAAELTRMGTLIGTPEYMAPEQFRGESVDARTDIYACGVLLYQMVTGQIPLSGEDWMTTSRLRMESAAPRPSELVPSTHERLEELILSALDRDPTVRPQGARQMQERLLEILPELANVLLPMRVGKRQAPRRTAPENRGWSGPTLPSPVQAAPAASPEPATAIMPSKELISARTSPPELRRASPALDLSEQLEPTQAVKVDGRPSVEPAPPESRGPDPTSPEEVDQALAVPRRPAVQLGVGGLLLLGLLVAGGCYALVVLLVR